VSLSTKVRSSLEIRQDLSRDRLQRHVVPNVLVEIRVVLCARLTCFGEKISSRINKPKIYIGLNNKTKTNKKQRRRSVGTFTPAASVCTTSGVRVGANRIYIPKMCNKFSRKKISNNQTTNALFVAVISSVRFVSL
jgi:hypothetical protein